MSRLEALTVKHGVTMDDESDGESISEGNNPPHPPAPSKIPKPKPVLTKLKLPVKSIKMNFVKTYINAPLFEAKDSYGKMNKAL